MTPLERQVIASLQQDIFEARLDVAHERWCIDNAMSCLNSIPAVIVSKQSDQDKISAMASLMDSAIAALRRRRDD